MKKKTSVKTKPSNIIPFYPEVTDNSNIEYE